MGKGMVSNLMQRRTLREEEIAFYWENGFVKVQGILSSEELDRFAEAVNRETETGRIRHLSGTKTGKYKTYDTLMEDCLEEPDINFIVDHPNIVGATERLLGGPALLCAFSIHLKGPGWGGTIGDYQGALETGHCDYKPFRPVGSSLNWMFTIIPLVDYTDDVGPLLVSPGSHRFSRFIANEGRVTMVERAKGSEIPPFVNTELKRGDVLFMHMFTWHEAHQNRSHRTRIGVYNKYMAADAPPGCGPYLYSDSNFRIFKDRGSNLLANHSDGLIASTRLILERDGKVLFLELDDGLWSLPGGAAQTEKKVPGSDDDNVIEQLYACLREQLGIELPWVSYVGDFPGGGESDLCRVYAYPELAGHVWSGTSDRKVSWFGEAEIARMSEKGKFQSGFEPQALRQWLHEPLLRGIGQSRSQVGIKDVKLVETASATGRFKGN